MGGIGSTLREERVRRGIGIDAVEADTKIRAKYLLALEEERYDELPGTAYVRAFLRDYAERLGLDPQVLIDWLNSGPPFSDDIVLAPQRPGRDRTLPVRWLRIAVIAGAAAVVAIAAFIGWRLIAPSHHAIAAPPASHGTTPAGSLRPPAPPIVTRLRAGPGATWLVVRQGPGAGGRVLYRGVLAAGARLTFRRHPLWMRVGAPSNLRVSVRGRTLRLPRTTAGDVLVTRRTVRRAA
jgi:hypothetical protein